MKKITCAILSVFFITPCLAVHINPNAVVDVIKNFVPEENVVQTMAEYNAQLKATEGDGIPASKLWNVCDAAGWNIEETSGMQQCSEFVIALMSAVDDATGDDVPKECPASINAGYAEYYENNKDKQITDDALNSLDEQGKKEAKLRNLCFGASLLWHGYCAYNGCNMCDGQSCNPFPQDNVDGKEHSFEQICKWADTDCFTADIKTITDIMKESGEAGENYWNIVGVDVEQQKIFQSVCEADGGTYSKGKNTYNQIEYDGDWCDGNKTMCKELFRDTGITARGIADNTGKIYCFIGSEEDKFQMPSDKHTPKVKSKPKNCEFAGISWQNGIKTNSVTCNPADPFAESARGDCTCTCNNGKWNCKKTVYTDADNCEYNGNSYNTNSTINIDCNKSPEGSGVFNYGKECSCSCYRKKWNCKIKTCVLDYHLSGGTCKAGKCAGVDRSKFESITEVSDGCKYKCPYGQVLNDSRTGCMPRHDKLFGDNSGYLK